MSNKYEQNKGQIYKGESQFKPQSDTKKLKVFNCETLNVRKGPSLSSPVLFIVKKDTVLLPRHEPVETTGWVFATDLSSGRAGYVMAEYLEPVEKDD